MEMHAEAQDPSPAPPMISGRSARLALVAILGLAALLRLWHLDQNGYGRQYYAAGVRSMLGSWHGFFFNAFDPAGFVSLDKPPVALWLQVASAKILGFSAFSVMLPQVLEGLVSVALVHHIVGRRFGRVAGLLAALFLALNPISVAIDRSNNTDSCLVMVLLFAVWALIRAAETGSGRLLVLVGALLGLGFNVKMAAALVAVPAFGLVYLCGAPGLAMRQRLARLGLAAVVMTAVSLSWVSAFDLTPPDLRPYAGSTTHNSMLELALLHNGLDRFVRKPPPNPSLRGDEVASNAVVSPAAATPVESPSASASAPWDQTPVGPLRLATPRLAAQTSWWLPLAVAGVVLAGWPWHWRRRLSLSAAQANVLVWAGWALSYAIALSFAGGVFHTYYLAVLGPPLAALAGIGASLLWQRWRDGTARWAVPLTLLVTAAWHAYIQLGEAAWRLDDSRGAMLALVLTLLAISGAGLQWSTWPRAGAQRAAGLATLALLAMLMLPLAWALSTVLVRPNVAAPAADIARLLDSGLGPAAEGPPEPAQPRSAKLLEFLRAHRQSERYLLAVPNALQAAPLIVRTGEPIMAMGGYLGRDPILTPSQLERMVNAGELRYAIVGGPSIAPPNKPGQRALAHWIRSHGRRVDPALWRESTDPNRPAALRAGTQRTPARLYDLRPEEAAQAPEGEEGP